MKILRLILIVVCPIFVSSCMLTMAAGGPVAKLDAEHHLLPVVEAIEAYKKETGHLPATLAEIQARRKEPFKLEERTDSGIRWTIDYKVNGDSYDVAYEHALYDLHYENGHETRWSYNPWR